MPWQMSAVWTWVRSPPFSSLRGLGHAARSPSVGGPGPRQNCSSRWNQPHAWVMHCAKYFKNPADAVPESLFQGPGV